MAGYSLRSAYASAQARLCGGGDHHTGAGQGILLTLYGVALGLVGAYALTQYVESLLYGVSATDPLTFAGISLLMVVVATLASIVPARRAIRIDPMAALRYE